MEFRLAAAVLALTTMPSKGWWILVTQERSTARRGSNLYSSKLPIQAYESLFADDGSCPKSASALAANGSINTETMSRIETGPTGRTTCPCSDIDCAASQERPQSDHLRTSVSPSASDLRSVATERCGSMQPSTPQASSTAVFSSSLSARNRHHGSVLVGASNPVINTPGLSLGPLSVQTPETPASQPTVVPAARHAMHEITHGPTESNEYQPPILLDHSLPIIQGIKIVRHPPAVLRPVPPVSAGEANHSELGGSPSGSSTSRPHHKVFFLTGLTRSDIRTLIESGSSAPSRLNAGANHSLSTPNNHPVETQIGSALSRRAAKGSPEPQERLDQVGSTSSNRLLGSVTATTDSTSSGTSAAAETSLSSVSSVSDRRGQQQALSIRDGRRRPLENPPQKMKQIRQICQLKSRRWCHIKGPPPGVCPLSSLDSIFRRHHSILDSVASLLVL